MLNRILSMALFVLPSYLFSNAAAADSVIFVVKNKTQYTLEKLEISNNNRAWSKFGDVKLDAGRKEYFEWHPKPSSNCAQYIRGFFSVGQWSKPFKIDFCNSEEVSVTFEP